MTEDHAAEHSYRPGGRIVLVPHDPLWSRAFEQESLTLEALVGSGLIAVHHIGSTAIPGIVAKPVIDMLAVVSDLAVLEEATAAMVAVGYEAKGEFGIPGRRYFRKDSAQRVRTHQMHGFQEGSTEIARHLAFRDYLRRHPDAARAYSRLKQELAERLGSDIERYADAKTPFIREIERKAMAGG